MSVFAEAIMLRDIDNSLTEYLRDSEKVNRTQTGVILGSFNKFHDQINLIIQQFEDRGISILAPKLSPIIDSGNGFPILEADLNTKNKLERQLGELTEEMFRAAIERIFQLEIKRAGFAYIVAGDSFSLNESGYAGITVAGEIGIAQAAGIPIYSNRKLDSSLDDEDGQSGSAVWKYVAQTINVKTVEDVAQMAKDNQFDIYDYDWCGSVVSPWYPGGKKFLRY